jgi:hypothetical protein
MPTKERIKRNRVIEGKKARQRTLDKLSVESGRAYTYDKSAGEGAGCLSRARRARQERQRKLDR